MPERCIAITKVQVGHVIGAAGSTLKGIQERTGARLEIVDGPQVKIVADEDAQADAAEAEVRRIVANQEKPDYEGPEGARLRQEANALGDKRGRLLDEATAKRAAGDHAAANKLVAEAKEVGGAMEARHAEAAAAIARYNNEDKGKGEDYLDMHGLREGEAMQQLARRVAVLEQRPVGTVTNLEVIPGAGHHSGPGGQKLKTATEAFMQQRNYEMEAISAGSFMVKVPGKGAAAEPPAKKLKTDAEPPAAVQPAATATQPSDVAQPTEAAQPSAAEKKSTAEPPESQKPKKEKKKKTSCCTCM